MPVSDHTRSKPLDFFRDKNIFNEHNKIEKKSLDNTFREPKSYH